MGHDKLDQYKGRLNPAQIAEGINAAQENARRLAEDAATLLEAGRYPTAASLAALSIEESGKSSILRSLALARDDSEAAKAWREYRSHTRKNTMWVFIDLVARGARRLAEFQPLFDPGSDHPAVLNHLKQLGLYTDCLGKAHWSRPSAVIDESLARALVTTARLLSSSSEAVTVTEIALWVKHLGPVAKRHPSWQERALENWYAAMQAAGLRPSGENKMSTFIRSGLAPKEPGAKGNGNA